MAGEIAESAKASIATNNVLQWVRMGAFLCRVIGIIASTIRDLPASHWNPQLLILIKMCNGLNVLLKTAAKTRRRTRREEILPGDVLARWSGRCIARIIAPTNVQRIHPIDPIPDERT